MKNLGLTSGIVLGFMAAAVGIGIGMSNGAVSLPDGNSITIISPESGETFTGSGRNVSVNFARNGTTGDDSLLLIPEVALSGYSYTISGIDNNIRRTKYTSTTELNQNFTESLTAGTYSLTVAMITSEGGSLTTGTVDSFIVESSFAGPGGIYSLPSITFASPTSGQTITGCENPITVHFSWQGSTGDGFNGTIDGYNYNIIRKSDGESVSSGNQPGIHNIVSFNSELAPGNYTLTVNMLSDEGLDHIIATESTDFTVQESWCVNITSPQENQTFTGDISTVEVPISLDGHIVNEYSRSNYTYELTSDNYTASGTISKGTSGTNLSLPRGNYTLTLSIINRLSNSILASDTKSFNVSAPSVVINTPSEGASLTTGNISISWSGYVVDENSFDHYEYIISGTNNSTGTIQTINGGTVDNISLSSGSYILTVNMFNKSGTIIASDTRNFTIDIIYQPSNKISIVSGNNQTIASGESATFTRNRDGLVVDKYNYTLSGTNNTYYSSGDIPKTTTTYTSDALSSGNYIFTISAIGRTQLVGTQHDIIWDTDTTNLTVTNTTGGGGGNSESITGSITITSGGSQTITSGNNVTINWTGSITPDSAFSGFHYDLSGTDNSYHTSGSLPKTASGYTSPALSSGNYQFLISVVDTGGVSKATATSNITVTSGSSSGGNPGENPGGGGGGSEGGSESVTGSVTITSSGNQTITSGNNVTINWTGSITPDSAFSGFHYDLSGTDNSYHTSGSLPKTASGYTSPALSSGNYTFTVSVISTSDQAIANDTTNIIVANNTPSNPDELNMTIYSPAESDTIRTNDVPFSFEGTYPSGHTFIKYQYYIKEKNRDGSTKKSGVYTTGGLKEFTYHLPDGKYYFEATIYTKNASQIEADKNEGWGFLVFDDIYLDITSPSSSYSCKTQTGLDFTRTGYAKNTFDRFEYIVTNNDGYLYTGSTTGSNDTSFRLDDLEEGNYTFNVKLYYTGGRYTEDEVHFCIELPDPESSLNITYPKNNKTYTGTSLKFSWNGSYDGGNVSYKYILDGPTYISGNTTSTSFTGNNLRDGTYNFSVEMIDSGDNTLRSDTRTFYIELPYTLKINSPTSGYNSPSSNVTLSWTGTHPYKSGFCYTVSGLNNSTYNTKCTTGTTTGLTLGDGKYSFTLDMMATYNNTNPLYSTGIIFNVNSNKSLNVSSSPSGTITGTNVTGVDVTVYWTGDNENFSSYRYTLKRNGSIYSSGTSTNKTGSKKYEYLPSGTYDFHIDMLNNTSGTITSGDTNFKIVIPTTLTFNTPVISQNNVTLGWTGFAENFHHYQYSVDTISGTKNIASGTWNQYYTGFTLKELQSDNYKLTVYIKNNSGDTISGNSISFTIDYTPPTPVQPSGGGGGGGGGGGYSSKSHPTNDLKLSIGNSSPSANEWIKLIVNIKDNYVGKVSFPKLQYYSGNAEKWIDIPVTSKNFVSDYSDDAKLGYIRFSSSDDGEKELSQFIKFSKNGYYRIYAEDKDGFDTYVQFRVGNTTNTNTGKSDVDSILREYIPEIFEEDTEEEIYIARSCKKYTIIYSDTLNIYTSPNLNISEFFTSKAYLKRYLDSKNRWQPGCPTNVGWITTNYIDRSNSNTRYTAPNGKVYLITGEEGNYYSNELNRELKTPSSFKTIQELKYYIRDRNPLINMATLGPVN